MGNNELQSAIEGVRQLEPADDADVDHVPRALDVRSPALKDAQGASDTLVTWLAARPSTDEPCS